MTEEAFDTSIENLRRIANESMDEIKKLTDEWISRDYSKWKCVDLRIRIRKKLEDKPQSRYGLSKWKKEKLIEVANKIDDNEIECCTLHYKSWMDRILDQKIRDRCEEQGLNYDDMIKAKNKFFMMVSEKYGDKTENFDAIEVEISNY